MVYWLWVLAGPFYQCLFPNVPKNLPCGPGYDMVESIIFFAAYLLCVMNLLKFHFAKCFVARRILCFTEKNNNN